MTTDNPFPTGGGELLRSVGWALSRAMTKPFAMDTLACRIKDLVGDP